MRFTTMCLLGLVLIAGCTKPPHEAASIEGHVGQNCMVYFRRDALGMASDSPSPVSTQNLNGVEVVQVGQLVKATPHWIVINFHGRELQIPQSSILMIEFGKNITQEANLAKPE